MSGMNFSGLAIFACQLADVGSSLPHARLQTHAPQTACRICATLQRRLSAEAIFLGQSLGVLAEVFLIHQGVDRVMFAICECVTAITGGVSARSLGDR